LNTVFSRHHRTDKTMITGIGSLPFTDIDEAIDLVFSTCREIPFWPQLPKRSPAENMYSTFLEGVPCVVYDEKESSVYIDTEKVEGIEEFYDNVNKEDLDAFAISEAVAPGLYRYLERIKEIEGTVRFLKGQLTGPFTMGLGVKDEKGKPILYNFAFFDMIKKALHMKARWMIGKLKEALRGRTPIIFFDEPYMVSFGSAYVSISKEEAIGLFNEVLGGLDAIRGIHCCGNTDWSVLLSVDTDIINYDAFEYLDTIFYYGAELSRYLSYGGEIAPGIIPSSGAVTKVTVQEMVGLWNSFSEKLETAFPGSKDKDAIITPSCGLGSLSTDEARRAIKLLGELGEAISRL
jgi:methionine synthase II (cobalamin-independent)